MDVNGNDNQPEWGWCKAPGCQEAALPIWEVGAYPDDPDLLLCQTHLGAEIARLRDQAAKAETAQRAWTEIGARSEADAAAIRLPAQLAANLLFNLDQRAELGPETRRLVKEMQLALDSALHDSGHGAALLAELNAARELKDWTRKWQRGEHIISTQMIRAMDAMDEAGKARAE